MLEINENNYWPSEKLKKEPLNKIRKKNLSLVGLMNIGNTCYMNSILQIFLNIQEIKDIFLNEREEEKFYEFIINKKKGNGELILEFINLLKEKYIKNKKTITPKKFKEICGKYNETFKGFEHQDAHEFYTFLVDNLHEDTNIKSATKNFHVKEESDTIDTTEIELSNEYWANTIRNNASYIYGLFFGQLKSTLTCSECNKVKLKYENFSALELPIPEGGKIIIEIILFRLPCTLSPFYKMESNNHNKKINNKNNKNYINNNLSDKPTANNNLNINEQEKEFYNENININIRKKLKKIKNISIGKYAIPNFSSPLNSDRDILNIDDANQKSILPGKNNNLNKYEDSNLNTVFYEKLDNINKKINKKNEINSNSNIDSSTIYKDELISNPLNLNIPIKLRIEIERNKKCKEIIKVLKGMEELELEENSKYTELLMISKNRYIKEDAIIDETILSFEQLNVYELLNYEGIKKVFGYEDIGSFKALPLKMQDVQNMIDINEEDIESNNNLTLFSENEKASSSLYLSSDYDAKNNSKLKINENNSINLDLIMEKNKCNTNEMLIRIIHGYRYLSPPSPDKDTDLIKIFNIKRYESFNTYIDYIILSRKDAIKPLHLYEMIWEKYMYFLDSPTKYESSLWWKSYSCSRATSTRNLDNQNNNNLSFNIPNDNANYKPFTIKIIKKSTKACIFCPWFRFCSGCPLNPANQNYLSLPNDILIIVDWKREVVKKNINENNILFSLNHSSFNQNFETSENEEEEKKSIYDCLDLFTHEEILKNIFCEKCNKKTNFKKRLEIDKFPKYLILILKRFKYTTVFSTKIDNLISFPIESLDITNYVVQKEGKIKYDLFGVVNHVGSLSGGHYHCDIKQENLWIKYDDSYTSEYDKKIETSNAYLLVYKYCEKGNIYNEILRQEYKLNLMGLMDTAYKLFLKQYNFEHFFNYIYDNDNTKNSEITEEYRNDCEFYYGEPLTVNGKMGYLINIYKKDDTDKVYIKIKLNKGYYETNISKKKVIKETVKMYNYETNESVTNKPNNDDDTSRVFCGGCLIN